MRTNKEYTPVAEHYLDGRPVEIIKAYLKGVDSFVEEAVFLDDGTPLTEKQLAELDEYAQEYLIQQNIETFGFYQK